MPSGCARRARSSAAGGVVLYRSSGRAGKLLNLALLLPIGRSWPWVRLESSRDVPTRECCPLARVGCDAGIGQRTSGRSPPLAGVRKPSASGGGRGLVPGFPDGADRRNSSALRHALLSLPNETARFLHRTRTRPSVGIALDRR